jgi:hypothetical protein
MYRWPIAIVTGADSDGDANAWQEATVEGAVEVSPRGLSFTLNAFCNTGHPLHIALLDAYIRGEVPVEPLDGLGLDTRVVASRLIGPLVLAHASAAERVTLDQHAWLPWELTVQSEGRSVGLLWQGGPELVAATTTRPLGIPPRRSVLGDEPRIEVNVELASSSSNPGPILARRTLHRASLADLVGRRTQGYEALATTGIPTSAASALRRLALGCACRHPLVEAGAAHELARALRMEPNALAHPHSALRTALLSALVAVTRRAASLPKSVWPLWRRVAMEAATMGLEAASILEGFRKFEAAGNPNDRFVAVDAMALSELVEHAGVALHGSRQLVGSACIDGRLLHVAMAPEADGGATLALLPPVEDAPIPDLVERMESAARAVLPGLMDLPFAEHRKEVIEHRLIGPEHTTTLLVGWSLVLPRNRRVFAAWLGSDGRVLIRLFPPEGQRARGRL